MHFDISARNMDTIPGMIGIYRSNDFNIWIDKGIISTWLGQISKSCMVQVGKILFWTCEEDSGLHTSTKYYVNKAYKKSLQGFWRTQQS